MCEEALCPRGACVECARAALAAAEFRQLAVGALALWRRALRSLGAIPAAAHCDPAALSLCCVLAPDASLERCREPAPSPPPPPSPSPSPAAPRKRRGRAPPAAPCACPDCGKRFASPAHLRVHLQNSERKEACPSCGEVVGRGAGLHAHLAAVHARDTLQCARCPALLDSRAQLALHARAAHGRETHTCAACGRGFARARAFERHARMHAVLACRRCGAQFENRSCYRVHRAACEPDAKPAPASVPRPRRSNLRDPGRYECDHCEKSYRSRPQLENHILWIHLDHRPHACGECDKRFYTAARLAEHSVVHTRVRNFSCDLCDARLVSKSAALYHRRRHTGEKPYECAECGAAFISASRRSEHAKRKHNSGGRLPCDRCAATFVRSRELQRHRERTHAAAGDVTAKDAERT